MKKILSILVAASGIALAAPASAIVVGGIDFGVLGSSQHIDTATLAQTYVNGNGQSAKAYGYISTINGASGDAYCATSGCGLYYVADFINSVNFSSTYVEFTSAKYSVYYTGSLGAINLLNTNSATNLATIAGMTPWLTMTGHGNLGGVANPLAVVNGTGSLTGASLTGTGAGLLDVDIGGPGNAAVIAFLDSDGVKDAIGGLADMIVTSSFNNFTLNPNDNTAGCMSGAAQAGDWCYQGTSNFRGDTTTSIPEPGSLALIGAGLIGLAGARRRKSK